MGLGAGSRWDEEGEREVWDWDGDGGNVGGDEGECGDSDWERDDLDMFAPRGALQGQGGLSEANDISEDHREVDSGHVTVPTERVTNSEEGTGQGEPANKPLLQERPEPPHRFSQAQARWRDSMASAQSGTADGSTSHTSYRTARVDSDRYSALSSDDDYMGRVDVEDLQVPEMLVVTGMEDVDSAIWMPICEMLLKRRIELPRRERDDEENASEEGDGIKGLGAADLEGLMGGLGLRIGNANGETEGREGVNGAGEPGRKGGMKKVWALPKGFQLVWVRDEGASDVLPFWAVSVALARLLCQMTEAEFR
jgi:hypothetical protein